MSTASAQPGILPAPPAVARYLTLRLVPDVDPLPALEALAQRDLGDDLVVGLGEPLTKALARPVGGLRSFPALTGAGFSVPSTQAALWCWLRGSDRGDLVHAARELEALLAPAFELESIVDGFKYADSRDLTGYVDGTENPEGEDAVTAAIVSSAGPGLDGSSFVAVQRWEHDLDTFESMAPDERDHAIGRRRSDDTELEDAPPSAHIKRTEQESFDPPAFVVRRSLPWSDAAGEGLVFVAFGRSLDAFETQLRRMVGLDDGVSDALFRFTRPTTGGYYWCPPMAGGHLDLRAVGVTPG